MILLQARWEGIDLKRTKEIADVIAPYGVTIAQHGISGTPLDKVSDLQEIWYKGREMSLPFSRTFYFGIKMDQQTGNAITEGRHLHQRSRQRNINRALERDS